MRVLCLWEPHDESPRVEKKITWPLQPAVSSENSLLTLHLQIKRLISLSSVRLTATPASLLTVTILQPSSHTCQHFLLLKETLRTQTVIGCKQQGADVAVPDTFKAAHLAPVLLNLRPAFELNLFAEPSCADWCSHHQFNCEARKSVQVLTHNWGKT